MVARAAREAGMSYGKYVALMHERGERPPSVPETEDGPECEPAQEERRCEVCGELLPPGARSGIKACGPVCRTELNRRRARERYQSANPKPTEACKCAWCGGEFVPNRRYQRFCGARCQEAHNRAVKRGEIIAVGLSPGMANRSYGTGECVICGEDFTKKSARQITCCAGCRKEYHARQRKEKKC